MLREDVLMKFAILKHLIGLTVVLGFAAVPQDVDGGLGFFRHHRRYDACCGQGDRGYDYGYRGYHNYGYNGSYNYQGGVVGDRGYWQPGGYENRVGSPYYYSAPRTDPYNYHYGPGFYRSGEYGHYRFPYYSYRRPWYYPGQPVYNRDTNLPW